MEYGLDHIISFVLRLAILIIYYAWLWREYSIMLVGGSIQLLFTRVNDERTNAKKRWQSKQGATHQWNLEQTDVDIANVSLHCK